MSHADSRLRLRRLPRKRPAIWVIEQRKWIDGSQKIEVPAGHFARRLTSVTRGMRVASFFWLQSMIRDSHARSLIFDLDTAIQALVERLGRDDLETVKLTVIYHNLIRYWADV